MGDEGEAPPLSGEERSTALSGTGPASPPPRRQGERVYDLLVEDADDVIGFVAYALYKQHKFDYIKAHPSCTDRDIEVFCDSVRLRADYYRGEGEKVLASMQQQLYAENLEAEQRRYEKELTTQVEKLAHHGFLYHLFQHVLASIVAIVLLYLTLIVLLGWQIGPTKLWGQIVDARAARDQAEAKDQAQAKEAAKAASSGLQAAPPAAGASHK